MRFETLIALRKTGPNETGSDLEQLQKKGPRSTSSIRNDMQFINAKKRKINALIFSEEGKYIYFL